MTRQSAAATNVATAKPGRTSRRASRRASRRTSRRRNGRTRASRHSSRPRSRASPKFRASKLEGLSSDLLQKIQSMTPEGCYYLIFRFNTNTGGIRLTAVPWDASSGPQEIMDRDFGPPPNAPLGRPYHEHKKAKVSRPPTLDILSPLTEVDLSGFLEDPGRWKPNKFQPNVMSGFLEESTETNFNDVIQRSLERIPCTKMDEQEGTKDFQQTNDTVRVIVRKILCCKTVHLLSALSTTLRDSLKGGGGSEAAARRAP